MPTRVPSTDPSVPTDHRRARRAPAAGAAAAGVAALLAACAGPDTTASATVPDDVGPPVDAPVVHAVDNDFEDAEVVVVAGTTVTWRFAGDSAHDVSGDGFASEVLADGEFTHTFTDVGTYPYTCTLHGGMDGVVYVVG